jgi:U4/U6.U5 tri-snRNP-associated protein 2
MASSSDAPSAQGPPPPASPGAGSSAKRQARSCPYLDTISRQNLDFDFQKLCSVTLSPLNTYCCLTCGKFFRGKQSDSPAYKHALEQSHYVWMNLSTGAVHCLPEDYSVQDNSLDDIRYNLRPTFTPEEVAALGTPGHVVRSRDLHGQKYLAGVIGLNDLHGTDFVNCVVQALARVPRLRQFFLQRDRWEQNTSRVVRAFGEIMCQMWSSARFKSSASPHELLQAISSASENRFRVGTRADAGLFLVWLLNELHKSLGGTKKPGSSVIHACFQGQVQVETTVIELVRDFDVVTKAPVAGPGPAAPLEPSSASATGSATAATAAAAEDLGTSTRASIKQATTELVPFTLLTLDLPTGALFTDAVEGGNIIPQTTLYALLGKYDGQTTLDETLAGHIRRKRYKITRLPECLILQLKRFTPNKFFIEKNRSVVTLPTTQLDLRPYMTVPASADEYDLVANICHEGGLGDDSKSMQDPIASGSYRAHIYYPPNESWFEARDLVVKETMPQLVAVSETYIAFYHKRRGLGT